MSCNELDQDQRKTAFVELVRQVVRQVTPERQRSIQTVVVMMLKQLRIAAAHNEAFFWAPP